MEPDILDKLDEEIGKYTNKPSVKSERAKLNQRIKAFRDDLTSKTQVKEFNSIIECLSCQNLQLAEHAFISGYNSK